MNIRRGCDGVVATILLVSACLAYPLAWKSRLSGVLWGYVLIFALNLVRVVGLFIAGLKGSEQTFGFLHTYVSQFIVIALTMVFWIYWAGREGTLRSLRIPVKPATQSGESSHPVGAKRRWGFHDVSGGRFESM